jgi:NADH:ubiquinone reductase (H+-translocating)
MTGSDPRTRRWRVLILGGGFGGAYAAWRLGQTLGKRPDVEVVLISRENYLLFTPMLHEVAAGDLYPPDIVEPLRRRLRNVRFMQGEVIDVDLEARVVRYAAGSLRRRQEIAYDRLLLALGSETNYFGMAQVAARAATLKTLGDAALLRNRMVALLEDASTETDEALRRRLMTFVVAGGGFAGVETVGAMNDFLRETLRHYPELDPTMLRVVLVHSGEVVLPELGQRLGRYAQEKLRSRGIELRLGARVSGYDDWVVKLSAGEPIAANTLVWTAGVTPAPAVASLPVEKIKGRVKVNQYLEVTGHEGVVWAVGDCAAIPDGRGGLHPPTAQHGLRQGLAAAKNIQAALDGAAAKPFRFSTIGQLASIGHHTGVAQILGIRFSGFAAWWLWRSVYLAKLPGISKKVRVAIQWTLDLVFSRSIEQFLTLKDVEQIEQLAAQVRASQPDLVQTMGPTTESAVQDESRRSCAYAQPDVSWLEA